MTPIITSMQLCAAFLAIGSLWGLRIGLASARRGHRPRSAECALICSAVFGLCVSLAVLQTP